MASIWSGFWNESTCDFRLLYSLVSLLRFILRPGLCKRDQCNTAEAAVASHGILRLKAWNVGLDREMCWTIELSIRAVLFLDLETVFFGRLKLNISAYPLNWKPCFLLDSSCIQHILGEKRSFHRVKGNSFLCEQCFARSCPAFECVDWEGVSPLVDWRWLAEKSHVAA